MSSSKLFIFAGNNCRNEYSIMAPTSIFKALAESGGNSGIEHEMEFNKINGKLKIYFFGRK